MLNIVCIQSILAQQGRANAQKFITDSSPDSCGVSESIPLVDKAIDTGSGTKVLAKKPSDSIKGSLSPHVFEFHSRQIDQCGGWIDQCVSWYCSYHMKSSLNGGCMCK